MKTVILDAAAIGRDLDLGVFSEFGQVEIFDATPADKVVERLRDADAAVLNKIKINAATAGAPEKLRLICVAATGYDNIDLDYCRERGIALCNVPSYSSGSVAQLTAAMVFSLSTNLRQFSDHVAGGAYSSGGAANKLTPVYHDLEGRVWGVVGYGDIGQRVAKIAEAAGCRVLVCRRNMRGEANERDIDALCRESDIISVHTPLNDSTRGLISRERIALMKKDAIVINVARGAVFDEEAIAEAVLDGRIGAFGTDVYSVEPFPADHPYNKLLGLPNVCMTPHMAWASYESRKRCVEIMASNLREFLAGRSQNRVV